MAKSLGGLATTKEGGRSAGVSVAERFSFSSRSLAKFNAPVSPESRGTRAFSLAGSRPFTTTASEFSNSGRLSDAAKAARPDLTNSVSIVSLDKSPSTASRSPVRKSGERHLSRLDRSRPADRRPGSRHAEVLFSQNRSRRGERAVRSSDGVIRPAGKFTEKQTPLKQNTVEAANEKRIGQHMDIPHQKTAASGESSDVEKNQGQKVQEMSAKPQSEVVREKFLSQRRVEQRQSESSVQHKVAQESQQRASQEALGQFQRLESADRQNDGQVSGEQRVSRLLSELDTATDQKGKRTQPQEEGKDTTPLIVAGIDFSAVDFEEMLDLKSKRKKDLLRSAQRDNATTEEIKAAADGLQAIGETSSAIDLIMGLLVREQRNIQTTKEATQSRIFIEELPGLQRQEETKIALEPSAQVSHQVKAEMKTQRENKTHPLMAFKNKVKQKTSTLANALKLAFFVDKDALGSRHAKVRGAVLAAFDQKEASTPVYQPVEISGAEIAAHLQPSLAEHGQHPRTLGIPDGTIPEWHKGVSEMREGNLFASLVLASMVTENNRPIRRSITGKGEKPTRKEIDDSAGDEENEDQNK